MNDLTPATLLQWAINGVVALLVMLMRMLKRAYDRRIEEVERRLEVAERDAHVIHANIISQTQLVSERVTKIEGTISATLTSLSERLTRIESLLDAMLRAGMGRSAS